MEMIMCSYGNAKGAREREKNTKYETKSKWSSKKNYAAGGNGAEQQLYIHSPPPKLVNRIILAASF